jgi:hypothetical protein
MNQEEGSIARFCGSYPSADRSRRDGVVGARPTDAMRALDLPLLLKEGDWELCPPAFLESRQ